MVDFTSAMKCIFGDRWIFDGFRQVIASKQLT
jgi:hypothetical protein